MKINQLWIQEQNAQLTYQCQMFLEKDESFWLSDQMLIDTLSKQNEPIPFTVSESEKLLFRANAHQITPRLDQAGEVLLCYHGQAEGWANVHQSGLLAMNFYSVYFPQQRNFSMLPFLLVYQGRPGHVMLEGKWDETILGWRSQGLAKDPGHFVIMDPAIRRVQENNVAQFTYFDASETALVSTMLNEVEQILADYQQAYGSRCLPKRKMISFNLADDGNSGAFQRGDWTFYTRILPGKEYDELHIQQMIGIMAHEFGHLWFTGADISSWEDWLIETGAEWACLRYLMKQNRQALLKQKLNRLLALYAQVSPIRTPDLKNNAQSVHIKGTALFLSLALRQGVEVVDQLLYLLAELPEKTTAALLTQIRQKLSAPLAEEIESLLDQSDFGLTAKDPAFEQVLHVRLTD